MRHPISGAPVICAAVMRIKNFEVKMFYDILNQIKSVFSTKLIIKFYFLILLLLQGCAASSSAPSFRVGVDSIVDPSVQQKIKYFLFPADSSVSPNDLYFKEYSNYVEKVLTKQGYEKTNIADAQILILLQYGIGDPVTKYYSYSIPVFGRIDQGDATVTSRTSSYGSLGNLSTSGNSTTKTEIKSKPAYGQVGSNTYSDSYTTYFRYLILEAIDIEKYKDTKNLNAIWKTTITSSGSSNDLRRVVPILVYGASNYIGKNTKQRIYLNIEESDPKFIQFKKSGD